MDVYYLAVLERALGVTYRVNDPIKDFNSLLKELSHDRGELEVLQDFFEMAFCALAKQTRFPESVGGKALEARYMAVVEKRPKGYIRKIPELLALTALGVRKYGDFLGRVAVDSSILSKSLGQFFTPPDVARLMVRMTLGEQISRQLVEQKWISVQEPAIGSGVQILALAEYLRDIGRNLETCLYVEGIDVSDIAYKMSYIQLSLAGIPARIFKGNTISMEMSNVQMTHSMGAFLQRHESSWLAWLRGKEHDSSQKTWLKRTRNNYSDSSMRDE